MSKENLLEVPYTEHDVNEIEQYDEFDYISDFYLPQKDSEELYNTETYKIINQNGIDDFEYFTEEKVQGIDDTRVKRVEEVSDQDKEGFFGPFLDFFKDLPESFAIDVGESFLNIANNATQLVGMASNVAFQDTKSSAISDFTNKVAKNVRLQTREAKEHLKFYAEERDINGVSQLFTDIGIDLGLMFPIQKQLKKTGMPSMISYPLAFGLAYGFTGGKGDQDKNLIISSHLMNKTNKLLKVLPDTPEDEVGTLVANTFEGTAWGFAGPILKNTFKFIKTSLPYMVNQQTAVGAGGSAAVTAGVEEVQDNIQNNIISEKPE